jgi:hypothetical protein
MSTRSQTTPVHESIQNKPISHDSKQKHCCFFKTTGYEADRLCVLRNDYLTHIRQLCNDTYVNPQTLFTILSVIMRILYSLKGARVAQSV